MLRWVWTGLFVLLYGWSALGVTTSFEIGKTRGGYVVEFEIGDVALEDVDTLGLSLKRGYQAERFSRITVDGHEITEEIGKPALPFYSFYLGIAKDSHAPTISVIESEVETIALNNKVFPAQKPWYKSQSVSERYLSIDRSYYAGTGVRKSVAFTTDIFTIRGVPCAYIQIHPITYNPRQNRLTITKKMRLQITPSAHIATHTVQSSVFERLLRYSLKNHYDVVATPRSTKKADDYLIITDPSFESNLSEFVNFRKKRFDVKMVTTSQTGSSASQIDNYIQGVSPTPAYVLLVGDVDKIPASEGSSRLTDLYYSSTDSDYYPDLLLGRFSVTDATELANVVHKTIYMENNLGKIEKRHSFLAGEDSNYWQVAERTHNYCIDNYLGDYENLKFYCHNRTIAKNDFIDALNNGVIYNFYSAHGLQTAWAPGDFTLRGSDLKALTNETHYNFLYGFCCLTGTYSTDECFTESAIRAKGGSVVAIGASISTTWTPDENVQTGIFDAIFDGSDPQTSVGASLMAGKMSNSSSKQTYFEVYNIMGDAAVEMLPVNIGPYLSVVKPTEGIFYVGDKLLVEWETGGGASVQNVKIEYSTDSGSTYTTIEASIPNNSQFNWTVPDIAESKLCLMKVSQVGGDLIGYSGLFSIVQKAAISITPATLSAQAMVGQTVTKELTIENTGKGTLTFSAMPAGASAVMINELYVSQSAFFDGLELWNRGPEVNLNGWKVEWKDNVQTSGSYTFSNITLRSGGTIVITDDNGDTNDSTFYMGVNAAWNREGGTELSIALIDDKGKGVDFVRSSGNNDSPPTGTAWSGTGVALSADYVFRTRNQDGDDAQDWTAGSSGTVHGMNPGQSLAQRPEHWLSLSPDEGAVDGQKNLKITVTFKASGLETGQAYQDTIIVTHNAADIASPLKVPCELLVDANAIVLPNQHFYSLDLRYSHSRLFFQVPKATGVLKDQVTIKLYTVSGKMIAKPVDTMKSPGLYSVKLRANSIPMASGVYLATIQFRNLTKTIRIVHK